jgi:DNA repair protein RecO (recombination protein O)
MIEKLKNVLSSQYPLSHRIEMYRLLHIIALRTVKYNDRHSILAAYAQEMGRISFLLPAGTGREASRRRALTMPLTPLECVASIRPDRDIHTMRDPRALIPTHVLHSDPMRNAVAMFLCEILQVVLRESQEDSTLFAFLLDAIARLNDPKTDVANFHLCFLYRLGRYIGIEPNADAWTPGAVFDMSEGIFRPTPPLHANYLSGQEAEMVANMSRMTWDNMSRFKLSHSERNAILDVILKYYTLHYTSMSGLHSLDVLRSLFR